MYDIPSVSKSGKPADKWKTFTNRTTRTKIAMPDFIFVCSTDQMLSAELYKDNHIQASGSKE